MTAAGRQQCQCGADLANTAGAWSAHVRGVQRRGESLEGHTIVHATANPCVDCVAEGVTTNRPAPHPGPRCVTHHRARRKVRAAGRHASALRLQFDMEPEDYAKLLAAQGNRCAICRRATGATKRLAVDHDHACCPGPTSCGKCVRGILCGPCNSMLAHARDDAELFRRAIRYLREWPSLAI